MKRVIVLVVGALACCAPAKAADFYLAADTRETATFVNADSISDRPEGRRIASVMTVTYSLNQRTARLADGEFDCTDKRFREASVTVYDLNRRPITQQRMGGEWFKPVVGSADERVLTMVCGWPDSADPSRKAAAADAWDVVKWAESVLKSRVN